MLLDGMDLVILGLAGASVSPSRARAVVARARSKGSTLVVTEGHWDGAEVRLDARVHGYGGFGQGRELGRGRLSSLSLAVRARGALVPAPDHASGHLQCSRAGRVGTFSAGRGCVVAGGVGAGGVVAGGVVAGGVTVSRVLALWCPDWPAVAAAALADLPATHPVAVTSGNRVIACSATARAEGVRRGLRRRESQARCPELYVAMADPERDARLFEPVAAAIDAVAPGVEVLRPGLLVLSARGVSRYFGSEEAAAERLVDQASAAGVESQVGVADQLSTAVIAARRAALVPPGGRGHSFWRRYPCRSWLPSPACLHRIAGSWWICCAGSGSEPSVLLRICRQWTSLRVSVPMRCSRIVRRAVNPNGHRRRGHFRRTWRWSSITIRRSSGWMPQRLPGAPWRVSCTTSCLLPRWRAPVCRFRPARVTVKIFPRTWRCAEPLTPEGTADRVRWQLDGWLTGRSETRPTAGIAVLRLEPVEVVSAGALQLGLWGGVGDEEERARRALVRVQGLLGGESVQVGVLSGGRGPLERITLLPLGDERVATHDPTAPWPGRLPQPSPGRSSSTIPRCGWGMWPVTPCTSLSAVSSVRSREG